MNMMCLTLHYYGVSKERVNMSDNKQQVVNQMCLSWFVLKRKELVVYVIQCLRFCIIAHFCWGELGDVLALIAKRNM